MIYFEQMSPPYEKYSVTNTGHVMDIDTGLYVTEQIDPKRGTSFVILEGSHNKTRKFYIAPLVGDFFVRNPYGLSYIYFKDSNVANNHADNLGYAINPTESKDRVDRPFRNKVEDKRHALIVAINNAIDKGNWKKAKQLGKELWELEGNRWEDRNL